VTLGVWICTYSPAVNYLSATRMLLAQAYLLNALGDPRNNLLNYNFVK